MIVKLLTEHHLEFWSFRKRGSSVVRPLPLVLEVPGSIPARGEKNSVSEHPFSSVI